MDQPMPTNTHALRSFLFAPADNQRILDKVVLAGSDAVFIDLEDFVAPAANAPARHTLRKTLEAGTAPESVPISLTSNSALGVENCDKLHPANA